MRTGRMMNMSRWLLLFACVLILSISPSTSMADDWTPPPPTGNDGFDWIELKSGEWLKGRIKSLRQEDLEFDSEELDVQVWDWEKIRTLRSPRRLKIRLVDNSVIDGALLVTMTEIQIVSDSDTLTLPRAQLMAIAPGGRRMRDKWSADVSVGISSSEGNTREFNGNAQLMLKREVSFSRQRIEYQGNYGELNGVVSTENHRWSVESDLFFGQRFFIRVPDLEYFRDPQQNLNYRITLGGSVGYDLIQTPRTEWQLTLGPAIQWNSYDLVEEGAENTGESKALVLGSGFETELTKRLDFASDYRAQFAKSSEGGNMQHSLSTLKFEIHKRLTLDLSLTWDRTAEPEPRGDGTTPEKDDFNFITSLGIHF